MTEKKGEEESNLQARACNENYKFNKEREGSSVKIGLQKHGHIVLEGSEAAN